jgi:serine/threonine protein phosphatase 1
MAYTKRCWQRLDTEAKERAARFFEQQVPYHVQEQQLFVHGGIHTDVPITQQNGDTFYWDRSLWRQAMELDEEPIRTKDGFTTIFIGHTPTIKWGTTLPQFKRGIWNLDTGAGFEDGRLTLMNLETKQYIQSDPVTVADD